jgi:methylated-DNA-[protein]-cysteine S-methyltransferase
MKGQQSLPFHLCNFLKVFSCSGPMKKEIAVVAAPFGGIRLFASGGVLVGIDVLPAHAVANDREGLSWSGGSLREAGEQMLRYLEDPRYEFILPVRLQGTPFQQRIWQALKDIPAGRNFSYGSLAKRLETGPRAVASACKSNRFPILIPCHRAVSANGLGGYCGETDGPMLEIKRWLLSHEGCSPGGDHAGSA